VRERSRDILTIGLLAAVLALIFVLVLGYLGELLMPVAFGPPILAQILVVERRGLQDTRQRARDLGSREWGRVIMYLLTLGLGVVVAILAVHIAIGEMLRALSVDAAALESVVAIALSFAAVHLLFALGWAFVAVAQTVIYLDLRARKDDLTPEELANERARLGASEDPDPSPD
jgi:hypothetical protein